MKAKLATSIYPSVFTNAILTLRDRIAKNIITSVYRRERVILMIDSEQNFKNKLTDNRTKHTPSFIPVNFPVYNVHVVLL